jgi:RNA-directed DNA polymerase
VASIAQIVADYIGHTQEEVLAVAHRAPFRYRRYFISKKRGGRRAIHHPAEETKALQYALMQTTLSQLRIHKSAVAYRRDLTAPLRANALAHAQRKYSIKFDFQDFFHCIMPQDLFKTFGANHIPLSEADREFLKSSLFLRPTYSGGLPIGAPSSPLVSNAVMYDFDEKMRILANDISADGVYTRYADDIVFSTNAKGVCHTFHQGLETSLQQIDYPTLRLNREKTLYTSRATRRVVTGLVITPNGNVSLGRRKKRYIRKLLFDFIHGRLNDEDRAYLAGYLAFILDVDPDFYNRLALKYTADTVQHALHWGGDNAALQP